MIINKITHAEAQRRGEKRETSRLSVFRCAVASLRLYVMLSLVLFLVPAALKAQDGFGFGDSDFGFGGGSSSSFSVNIGGEVSAGFTWFFDDCGSAERIKNASLGDVFSGSLNFEAGGSAAQGVINLNLIPVFDGSSPLEIDEVYVRAFFGPVTVTGGIRKLSWGKADSFGPLDVVNPLDYRDLTKLSDPQSIKIARPMIHALWSMGSFSKLEAVFVPWFQGHKFAATGIWAPRQITTLPDTITGYVIASNPLLSAIGDTIQSELEDWIYSGSIDEFYPETTSFKYAQAGMRFTTSLGSSDLGFQYYFGRLPRPAVLLDVPITFITPPPPAWQIHPEEINVDIAYNYYHQIGADFASVIAGFNLRAEAGANITEDLDGKDGAVENPSLVWSLGFDRNVVWGIKINLQGTGRVRLFHAQIDDDPLIDCEAGNDVSSTRITAIVSRKFFNDELELKASGLWGIEDRDFLVMPAIIWSRNGVSAELAAGFFGGDEKGELGQYADNGFMRVLLSYKF